MSADPYQHVPAGAMAFPPPAPARSDSTRVIAIIALVLSALALVVPLGMFVGPMLLFGAFAGGDSFDMGSPTDAGSSGSGFGGQVRVRDGFVAGAALQQVVRATALDGERVSCPDTRGVREGTTVLCTAGEDDETYVVVRFEDAGGDVRVDWFTPDDAVLQSIP